MRNRQTEKGEGFVNFVVNTSSLIYDEFPRAQYHRLIYSGKKPERPLHIKQLLFHASRRIISLSMILKINHSTS